MIHRWRMRRTLLAYSEGTLPPRRNLGLSRHLERCANCRATLESWAEADRLLQNVSFLPPRLSEQAADALFQRALAKAAVGAYRPVGGRVFALGGMALTCALALGLVWPRIHVQRSQGESALPPAYGLAAERPSVAAILPAKDDRRIPPQRESQNLSPLAAASRGNVFGKGKADALHFAAIGTASRPLRHYRAKLRRTLLQREMAAALPAGPRPAAKGTPTNLARYAGDTQAARLLVVVTHEPQIRLTVTYAADAAPGYARVACLQADDRGSDACTTCTVSNSAEEVKDIEVLLTYTDQDKTARLLKVATRERYQAKDPGDKP